MSGAYGATIVIFIIELGGNGCGSLSRPAVELQLDQLSEPVALCLRPARRASHAVLAMPLLALFGMYRWCTAARRRAPPSMAGDGSVT